MSRAIIFLLFLVFLLSRFIFINIQEVFFDSAEYLSLFSNSNFLQALYLGHAPPHIGYPLLFWSVFHLAKFIHLNPIFTIIVCQILLGFLTIFCFYKFLTFISDKKVALIASIIASLTPLFWITNVAIMMEIAYVSFFFASLYFLICYLSRGKQLKLHASLCFLSLAVLTHTMTVLWIPLYLSVVFFKKKKELVKIFLFITIYITGFSMLNILFLSKVLDMNIASTFNYLFLSKGGEFASLALDLKGFFVAMRNFLIPLVRNNTSLIFILGFLALLISFRRSLHVIARRNDEAISSMFIRLPRFARNDDSKFFTIGVLWLFPAIYANQWWDSLLNGRHALITSFGFAFMTAYLIRKKTLLVIAVILYLLFVSLPTLNLLRQPIPYLVEADFVKSLPKGSLFIESHFVRPQVQEIKSLNFFFINEPGFDKSKLVNEIDKHLKANKEVFVSSAALSEPYGLYSGPYLHNITLSYAKPFELESVIKQYTLEKYKEINAEDNLLIYKIKSSEPSPYPEIKNMRDSYRRIDYHDPLWRVSNYILEYKWLK